MCGNLKTPEVVGESVGYNTRPVTMRSLGHAERAIRSIGCHDGGIPIMAPKALHFTLRLEGVDSRAAVIMKQEMLSAGGEAAVCMGVIGLSAKRTDILVMGTRKQLLRAASKLKGQPFGAGAAADEITGVLRNMERGRNFTLDCMGQKLRLGKRTCVMGVLNVTPDSFSNGGNFLDEGTAVEQGLRMAGEGADIIDIGGESSRPGAAPLSASAEKKRVLPVIRRLSDKVKIPISIDTYKPDIAREALDAGASIINDIFGLRKKGMAELAARKCVPVIIMHMQGTPRSMQLEPRYTDVVGEVHRFLAERVAYAQEHGIAPEQIVLDPGIGFRKTVAHNCELLARLGEFRGLGKPLLIGVSRKSFIGKLLDLPVGQRLEGSLAAAVTSIIHGATVIRVHDVGASVRAARIADAIMTAV